MIVSYSPSQIKANDSVNDLPQNRFVELSAMADVNNNEISKHIKIRTVIDLKSEAICWRRKFPWILHIHTYFMVQTVKEDNVFSFESHQKSYQFPN